MVTSGVLCVPAYSVTVLMLEFATASSWRTSSVMFPLHDAPGCTHGLADCQEKLAVTCSVAVPPAYDCGGDTTNAFGTEAPSFAKLFEIESASPPPVCATVIAGALGPRMTFEFASSTIATSGCFPAPYRSMPSC